MLITALCSQPQNFTSIRSNFNSKRNAAFRASEAEIPQDSFESNSENVEPKNSEISFLQKCGSKVTLFFNQIKTAVKPDEPEISRSVITYEPDLYDDIDLKADVIKALDEKGKLVHLVAKLGLDEVYDYVTGVDHDKLTTRYMALLDKEQFTNLSHYYCLYTTAYNIVELMHGDVGDSDKIIEKIKYLKRYINNP